MATGPHLPPDDAPGPPADGESHAPDEPYTLARHTLPSPVKRETDVAGPPTDKPSSADGPPTAVGPVTKRDPLSVMTLRESVGKAPVTLPEPLTAPRPVVDTPSASNTPQEETRVQPVLRVVRGEAPNYPFPLLDGRNYIGRATPDRPMDIDLTGQEAVERVWASRQHAVVTVDRGAVFVEDLNSLNGTFVNRVRIHPGHPRALQNGDIVQIGTVQMRLEV